MFGRLRWRIFFLLFLTFSLRLLSQDFPANLSAAVDHYEIKYHLPVASQERALAAVWESRFPVSLPNRDYQAIEQLFQVATTPVRELGEADSVFFQTHWSMAIFLSGMNPVATDRFDRKGLWLLPFHVARRYGLEINESIDERMLIGPSTRVARAYYEHLKDKFSTDAALAFVFGPSAYLKTDVEELMEVRRILLALDEIKSRLVAQPVVQKLKWTQQTFPAPVDIQLVCEASGANRRQFRLVNGPLVGGIIPAGYPVLLPKAINELEVISSTWEKQLKWEAEIDSARVAIAKKVETPDGKRITYRVQSGDVLGRIAERFGVKVSDLRQWNKLSGDMIRIGQQLIIYYSEQKALPKDPEPVSKLPTQESLAPGEFVIYKVQPGDTLWQISRKYEGVTPEDIMGWNGINEKIDIGQQLKIKSP